MSDVHYTNVEVSKAMCSLVQFLRFTGEDESMFPAGRLPSLDTELWIEDGEVMFSFFEKPTVGNKVLNKYTALPQESIRSSLLQETVRRMINRCEKVELSERQMVLSKYAQKLINSGHSASSAKLIIVHGVIKYLHKLKRSKGEVTNRDYKPLYLSKEYMEKDRQVNNYLARSTWFKKRDGCGISAGSNWKKDIPVDWRGSRSSQEPVQGINFTSVIKIPNTRNGELYKRFVIEENKLAKITGYNVKLIESSGIQLIRLFPRVSSRVECHWSKCSVCDERGDKPSRCRTRNLVYEGVCLTCESEAAQGKRDRADVGIYIGESSRTLAERAAEHSNLALKLEDDSFIVKHWMIKHENMEAQPRIRFRPLKSYKDAMTRVVAEAVWIEAKANMNSKGEWRTNKISRLKTDESSWAERENAKSETLIENKVLGGIERLKNKSHGGEMALNNLVKEPIARPKPVKVIMGKRPEKNEILPDSRVRKSV